MSVRVCTGMSASSKEARYFKVTAREPLADLRRRQAEEEAEAERLREAAYATVGDYDSEVYRLLHPLIPVCRLIYCPISSCRQVFGPISD